MLPLVNFITSPLSPNTRAQWKAAVQPQAAQICSSLGFEHRWMGSGLLTLELNKNGQKVQLTQNGMWFMGTTRKNPVSLLAQLGLSGSIFMTPPCSLPGTPYLQPSGRLAITAALPTSLAGMQAVIGAIDLLLPSIAALPPRIGPLPPRTKRQPKKTFREQCELVIRITGYLVGAGLEKSVSRAMAARVFGIAHEAPVVGESSQAAAAPNARSRKEHIVPCAFITARIMTKTFHALPFSQRLDEVMRVFKIVRISHQEQQIVDRVMGLKNDMPLGWQWATGCVAARLTAAGIAISTAPGSSLKHPPCGCCPTCDA